MTDPTTGRENDDALGSALRGMPRPAVDAALREREGRQNEGQCGKEADAARAWNACHEASPGAVRFIRGRRQRPPTLLT